MKHELPRCGILDGDILQSLRNLVLGDPIEPNDLWKIELALRAFMLMPVLSDIPDQEYPGKNPVGDSILDYDFKESSFTPPLLSKEEDIALSSYVEEALTVGFNKPFEKLTLEEASSIMNTIPQEHWGLDLESDFDDFVETAVEVGDLPSDAKKGAILESFLHDCALNPLLKYANTLVRLHRAGCVVFSNTPVGSACQQYMFSAYPLRLFQPLDEQWKEQARLLLGPGISVSVPPLFAVVLTRAHGRHDLSDTIRDLREEYATSRDELWSHLEELWTASTLTKQSKLLVELEKAAQSLFPASFPERQNFLDLAWSATIKIAEAHPLSAIEEIGKTLLQRDEPTVSVNAIGFTRKLSSDLKKIGGLSKLLPRILSKAEAARFGLRPSNTRNSKA